MMMIGVFDVGMTGCEWFKLEGLVRSLYEHSRDAAVL